MIIKWETAPAPSEKNPGRHKLLMKGEMKDVFLVVKKLGSICSRPEKAVGDFNFVIYLSKLAPDTLDVLKVLMTELSAPSETTPHRSPSPASPGLLTPQFAAPVSAPPVTEPFEIPAPKLKTSFEEAPPVSVPPAAAPVPATPRVNEEPVKPSTTAPKAKEEPAAAVPAAQKAVKPSVTSPRGKAKWSVELPLVPTHSFQTLVSGSHNRFAHAAAMAVVENPGVMYNPLLVFGIPGTGKTHFVHSISYGLSSSIGQNNIFVTDGMKFSKGVDMAVADGTIGALEEIISKVKVLVIDDIHLLMLTEANKPYISRWLRDFMAKNKQIVVTSLFPPKSLGGLEDAVGFQFTQGWMVDLKFPATQTYMAILEQLLQGMDIKLSVDDINSVFSSRNVPFGEVVGVMEGMKKLEKFVVNAMNPLSHAQLLEMLLGLNEASDATPLNQDESSQSASWSPSTADSWFKWGIFYPKGMAKEAHYVLYKLHARAAELGLNIEWQQIFTEEYDPDELYGIPFKIGNIACGKNTNGVIVLGPGQSSALGAQEAEFRHITLKILESFLMKGSWIQPGQMRSPAAYARILMDLL